MHRGNPWTIGITGRPASAKMIASRQRHGFDACTCSPQGGDHCFGLPDQVRKVLFTPRHEERWRRALDVTQRACGGLVVLLCRAQELRAFGKTCPLTE